MFFLVLSAGFWLFLTLDEEYEVVIAVPVKLKNVPDNVVITTPLPSEIKVRLHDHGGVLMKYRFIKQLGTIVVDFNNYDKFSGHVALPTNEVAKVLLSRMQATTRIVSFSPDTLEYFFNFGTYRKVPVIIRGSITADSLYAIADTTIAPRYVKVYGSKELLDTLRAVYTKPLSIEGLSQQESTTAQIAPIRGAKIVPSKITATFNVDQVTEKTVQVPVEHINFPAGKTLKTFPGIVNVTFHVGMKQYKNITADKFAIVISYEDLANTPSNRLKLSLKSKPKGISHVRIQPEDVEFLIEDTSEN